jgi:hypothetical protein
LIEKNDEDEPTWPKKLYKLSFSNFGAGRGKLKQKRDQFQFSNQYSKLLKQPSLFYPLTHTTYEQFNFICDHTSPLTTKIKTLDWRNKVLLTLR